jgi:hypothetical protein
MNPHTSHVALRDELNSMTIDAMRAHIFDNRYNKWIGSHCNARLGKQIPYIGWFWRSCNFYHGYAAIGDCGQFIGIMQNNKWDYPERNMTPEEIATFLSFIDNAMVNDNKDEDDDTVPNILKALWDWMQTLKIER